MTSVKVLVFALMKYLLLLLRKACRDTINLELATTVYSSERGYGEIVRILLNCLCKVSKISIPYHKSLENALLPSTFRGPGMKQNYELVRPVCLGAFC